MSHRSERLFGLHGTHRRRFCRRLAAALVAVPSVLDAVARAPAAGRLAEDDPTAMKLGYTRRSATSGETCGRCRFFRGGDAAWGPCEVFSGKLVAREGHCRVWAERRD